MGGIGSGRRNGGPVTADKQSIDIRQLDRDGLLDAGLSFSIVWKTGERRRASIRMDVETGKVMLGYRAEMSNGRSTRFEYPVMLNRTECNFGGSRPWFICPCCKRRIAVLYLGGNSRFACRRCSKLAYRSQRETEDDRALRRINKLRRRLGWPPGVIHGHGAKPKGMHWTTFLRLLTAYDKDANRYLARSFVRTGVLESKLSSVLHELAAMRTRADGV